MPLFDLKCDICGNVKEDAIVWMGTEPADCCGTPMRKLPSMYGMVKWKGEGGYPSRRKEFQDNKHLMSRKQVSYLSNGKIPAST